MSWEGGATSRRRTIYVLDSSAAVFMHRLGYIERLRQDVGQEEVYFGITPAVARELTDKPGEAGSDLPGRSDLIGQPLVPSREVLDQLMEMAKGTSLHAGELETIAAVRDLGLRRPRYDIMAAIDDRAARMFAQRQGLQQGDRLVGSLGLLAMIHAKGWHAPGITFRQDVERLVDAGARLNPKLLEGVVQKYQQEQLIRAQQRDVAQASPPGPQVPPQQRGGKEPEHGL